MTTVDPLIPELIALAICLGIYSIGYLRIFNHHSQKLRPYLGFILAAYQLLSVVLITLILAQIMNIVSPGDGFAFIILLPLMLLYMSFLPTLIKIFRSRFLIKEYISGITQRK